MLLFYKTVDKSVLKAGFTISVSYVDDFFEELGFSLSHGESRNIDIVIKNKVFKATLTSIGFDKDKYPNHRDLLQIRYSQNSEIAIEMKKIFHYTKNLIDNNGDIYSSKWLSSLPENKKEFLAVYSNPDGKSIIFDCITNDDFGEESEELVSFGETIAESILNGTDTSAEIIMKTKMCKIRHLSKTIGDDLKKLYDYRCQICGASFENPYGSNLIHAHHIDYFVNSKNNNASNIMILCPNHHSIVHDKNPQFDRKKKAFVYPNGYIEHLMLNYHL